MKDLTKALQEGNREEYKCKEENCELIGQYHGHMEDLDDLDDVVAQTVQATLERVRECPVTGVDLQNRQYIYVEDMEKHLQSLRN